MTDPDRPYVGWTFQMTQAQLNLKLAEARADALREVRAAIVEATLVENQNRGAVKERERILRWLDGEPSTAERIRATSPDTAYWSTTAGPHEAGASAGISSDYTRGRADALREAAERVLTTLPQYVDDEGPAPTHWVPLSGVLAILDPKP